MKIQYYYLDESNKAEEATEGDWAKRIDVEKLITEHDEWKDFAEKSTEINESLRVSLNKVKEELAKYKQVEKEGMARRYLKTFESEDKE